jgi:hypothetical protein
MGQKYFLVFPFTAVYIEHTRKEARNSNWAMQQQVGFKLCQSVVK